MKLPALATYISVFGFLVSVKSSGEQSALKMLLKHNKMIRYYKVLVVFRLLQRKGIIELVTIYLSYDFDHTKKSTI